MPTLGRNVSLASARAASTRGVLRRGTIAFGSASAVERPASCRRPRRHRSRWVDGRRVSWGIAFGRGCAVSTATPRRGALWAGTSRAGSPALKSPSPPHRLTWTYNSFHRTIWACWCWRVTIGHETLTSGQPSAMVNVFAANTVAEVHCNHS